MKRQIKFPVSLLLMIVLLFGGCQKDSVTTTNTLSSGNVGTSEGSLLFSDQVFEGLNGLMDGFVTLSGLKSATLGSCPSVSISPITSAPIIITFDWGSGCTSAEDGITRSGKITITLTGMMNVENSVATFNFTDFVHDGNKITGIHKITSKGVNASNWPRFNVLTEAKIEFPDKKFITYRAVYVRLQSEGSGTPLITTDDVWRIEGTANGKSKEGVAWTASYPSALVKKGSCKWYSSGSVLITPDGELPRTINYGDGTCDNIATLKIGDKTTTIELK